MDYIADSFYHFTSRKEYLFSIIKNGFYPRYCIENYSYLLKKYSSEPTIAIPMVCFCDIPIVFIEEHIKNYGEFAIAMKKEWGRKKLNPLFYLMDDSIPQKKLELLQGDLFGKLINNYPPNEDEEMFNHFKEIFDHFMDFIAYIKKYKGLSSKHGKKEIIFYREREWRWIPEIDEEDIKKGIILRLEPSDYPMIANKNKLIEEEKKYRLEFSTDDVDYLIVDSEETKQELEQLLSNHGYNKPQLIDKVHILEKLIKEYKEILSNKK